YRTFRLDSFEEALKGKGEPFSIIHIASHGFFGGEPEKTFVLTYETRLNMNKLEDLLKFERAEPVELLTLSACDTAHGDDRAALGLGGVAVKAGARAALASLWPLVDESTELLVPEFYSQLRNSGLSKAQALRNAQLSILRQERYSHPAYWSPFILIGNWL
ncbi:MAG: CHAT domain-containing protein, partial [Rhodospirillales bacterium]|nr:CHAT domain-containing protein [Rhodospirillales bacterium]